MAVVDLLNGAAASVGGFRFDAHFSRFAEANLYSLLRASGKSMRLLEEAASGFVRTTQWLKVVAHGKR